MVVGGYQGYPPPPPFPFPPVVVYAVLKHKDGGWDVDILHWIFVDEGRWVRHPGRVCRSTEKT